MIKMRRPAYTGLEPQPVQWKPASKLEQREIGVFFDSDIEGRLLKKVDAQRQELVGCYRVRGDENAFVKVLSNEHAHSHYAAEGIAAWLQEQGLRTNRVRDGYPQALTRYPAHIFVYNYIDYRFSRITPTELYAIGQGLGKMHARLSEYPGYYHVMSVGRAKNDSLRQRLLCIKQGQWSCPVNSDVTEILRHTKPTDLDLTEEHAQMIHGDMNYGNVLVDPANERPIFIDFEDATTSWLSPLYDVAFVIQRFILGRQSGNSSAVMDAFIEGYSSAYRIPPSRRDDPLYIIYRMISVRAMLLLSLLPNDEQAAYRDEYEKFVFLYQDAESKVSLINTAYEELLH